MPASIENAKTPVRLNNVALMPNVVLEITDQSVLVCLITSEILMKDAAGQNVLRILIVLQPLHVETKSVLIHVIVPSMQIVPQETIEEFVFADQATPEIHMESHVLQYLHLNRKAAKKIENALAGKHVSIVNVKILVRRFNHVRIMQNAKFIVPCLFEP